jgi:hypothetical protein
MGTSVNPQDKERYTATSYEFAKTLKAEGIDSTLGYGFEGPIYMAPILHDKVT